jgi:hypothetical protein
MVIRRGPRRLPLCAQRCGGEGARRSGHEAPSRGSLHRHRSTRAYTRQYTCLGHYPLAEFRDGALRSLGLSPPSRCSATVDTPPGFEPGVDEREGTVLTVQRR